MLSEKKYEWIVQTFVVLILWLSWSRNCAGIVYPVGGNGLSDSNPLTFNWFEQRNTSFYQDWADSLGSVADTDYLSFSYNKTLHNVIIVQTEPEFDRCLNDTIPIFHIQSGEANVRSPVQLPEGENQTWYVFSNTRYVINDSDCVNGMKFKITVHGTDGVPKSKKRSPTTAIAVSASIGGTFLIAAVCAVCGLVRYKRHKPNVDKRGSSGDRGSSVEDWARRQKALKGILEGQKRSNTCTIYSFNELDRATNKFSIDNKLGSGGFGTVYKGTLDNGTIVAVKRTNNLGGNDKDQFLNEVSILSQVNNRHLAKLLGCCVELDVPLLVFEFISNGTVQDQLVNARAGYPTKLDWATRFRIAIQTAEALKYLHFQATPPIFHRDVKSANILLDDNFNVKVADFGLSKLVDLDQTHVSTLVRGTPGYLDPEYYHNFQLTDKTDVYSFGMVLLELVTSKKPVDLSREPRLQNLAVASIPAIRAGRTREIVDQNFFSNSFTEDDYAVVEGVAQIAAACLGTDRESRPSMKEVVEMLQSLQRGAAPNALNFLARTPNVDPFDSETGYSSLFSQSSVGNSGPANTSTSDQPESSAPTTLSRSREEFPAHE